MTPPPLTLLSPDQTGCYWETHYEEITAKEPIRKRGFSFVWIIIRRVSI